MKITKKMIRVLSLVLMLFCTSHMGGSFLLGQDKNPNIILILTDDQGWTHVSHRADPDIPGSESDFYETPNMDRLAHSGIMFTQGYAPNPICSPSRNSVMFGQNGARHIYNIDSDWYKKTADWLTIPRAIKKANPNYKTAHFGKWHIAMVPEDAGFDCDDGMTSNSGGEIFGDGFLNVKEYTEAADKYMTENNIGNPSKGKRAGKPSGHWDDKNAKDIFGITSRAKDFMRESIAEGRPFYLQLSHYAAHLSLVSQKETYEYFKKKKKGERHTNPEFAAMLKDLDTGIGMIMDFVEEQGIENDTYIFLMGDNGGRLSLNQIAVIDENKELVHAYYSTQHNRNIPLRDGKHSFYEGGIRVPFMAVGPGISANRISRTPVTGLDFLPTFAELAGYQGEFPQAIDGGSLLPLLLNERVEHVERSSESLIFHQSSHRKPRSAIRKGDYKLIKYWSEETKYKNTPKIELFNIADDLGETKDLSGEFPEVTRELETELYRFLEEVNAETGIRNIKGPYYRLLDDLEAKEKLSPAQLVYPLLDAANSRWFYFSSATRPFGMVNLSPDMGVGGAWDSGYRYDKDTINFFSHIHAWQLSGVPVMPVTGAFKGHLGVQKYGSAYSHETEVVRAGYHAVELETYQVKAELSATTRVGFHRYSYPADKEKYLLLDLGTMLGPGGTKEGYARQLNNNEIAGYALMEGTRRRPKATYVYYVIKFDTPFENMQAWQNGKLLGETDEFEGSNGGVYVNFMGDAARTIQMKVAISYVGTEQARLNMQSELPHWDFDQVANEAFEEWNNWLSRIEIEGGTKKQQSRFYTDLWHALQGRRIISDFNGKYCDMTGEKPRTGQIPLDEKGHPRFQHYNSDAFWGAQWTINTLWHLVYPEVSEAFVNSMLLMYGDGGLIPRGPSGGNYTYVMTGASSTPFIVSAYMKGIRGFNIEKAYEGMRKNALPGGIMAKAGYEHHTNLGGGLDYYIEKGYVPFPLPEKNNGFHNEGAGQTLEYAYQDWCLAQMANELGRVEDFRMFMKRAGNYKNVWDAGSGWMRPRQLDGSWIDPFNPILSHHGFVESSAAQSTWFVPHDLKGLFSLMGGHEKASTKLNQQFLIADVHDFISRPYKADRIVNNARRNTYLNYGNQPSMQVGFIFNYAGKPWLTQYWTREVVNRIYSDLDPHQGYNGDEDQGFMGSLAVLLKIGLFQMRGGAALKPIYEIGSPLFDKVTLKLNPDYYEGSEFVIETRNNSDENRYLQSVNLNGRAMDQVWFYHDDMVKGGRLILEMGDTPNKKLGNDPQTLLND